LGLAHLAPGLELSIFIFFFSQHLHWDQRHGDVPTLVLHLRRARHLRGADIGQAGCDTHLVAAIRALQVRFAFGVPASLAYAHTDIYGFEGPQRSTFTNSSTSSPSAGSTCMRSRLAKPRLPYGGTCSCYSPSTFAHIDTPHRIEHLAKFKKAQSHALGEVKRKVKSGLRVVTGERKEGEKKKDKEEPSQMQEEKGGAEEPAREKGKGKEQVEERKDKSQKSQPQPQEEGEEEEEELTKDSRAGPGPGPESTEGKSEVKDSLKPEPRAKIAEEPSVSPLPTSPGSPRSDG